MTIFKTPLGIEDVSIGNGITNRDRNTNTNEFNLVNIPYNCGLLNSNYKAAPNVDVLLFTGFYVEGDLGAGLYERLDTDQGEDIGVILQTEYGKYRRIGSENAVMPEWFGAKGDGVANDIRAFEVMLKGQYNIRLQPHKTYYMNTFTNIVLQLPYVYIQGNGATIKTSRDNYMFRITLDNPAEVYINNLVFDGPNTPFFFTVGDKGIPGNVTYNIFNNLHFFDQGVLLDTSSEQTLEGLTTNKLFTIDNSLTNKSLATKKEIDEGMKLPDTVASKQAAQIDGQKIAEVITFTRDPGFTLVNNDIMTVDETKKYLEDNVKQFLPDMQYKLVSVQVGETYTQYKANTYTGTNSATKKQDTIFLYTDKLNEVTGGYRIVDGSIESLLITVTGTTLNCNNGVTAFTVSGGNIVTDYLTSQEPQAVYGGIWSLIYTSSFCKHWRKL